VGCLLCQGKAECAKRDDGQALPTLVPVVFSFLTTPLHHPHPLGRRGFGLVRQPGALDMDVCRRNGQITDAGIWSARHVYLRWTCRRSAPCVRK
jgi:hypothetical protein